MKTYVIVRRVVKEKRNKQRREKPEGKNNAENICRECATTTATIENESDGLIFSVYTYIFFGFFLLLLALSLVRINSKRGSKDLFDSALFCNWFSALLPLLVEFIQCVRVHVYFFPVTVYMHGRPIDYKLCCILIRVFHSFILFYTGFWPMRSAFVGEWYCSECASPMDTNCLPEFFFTAFVCVYGLQWWWFEEENIEGQSYATNTHFGWKKWTLPKSV